jgi:hypothetical protein
MYTITIETEVNEKEGKYGVDYYDWSTNFIQRNPIEKYRLIINFIF